MQTILTYMMILFQIIFMATIDFNKKIEKPIKNAIKTNYMNFYDRTQSRNHIFNSIDITKQNVHDVEKDKYNSRQNLSTKNLIKFKL